MPVDPYSTGLPPCPDENPDCGCDGVELSQDVNPNKNCCTKCTGDTKCNIWFQLRAPGYPGRCILDELTYDQVYEVLRRNPNAARDLMRITTDPKLLSLAREVKLTESPQDDDARAEKLIDKNTLPYYTVMKGNTGGDIR